MDKIREPSRDQQVQRVIVIEGAANAAVLLAKVAVGLGTGSIAILGDAIHSLTDVANNVVAWMVVRLSAEPADSRHPYGHRKFESVAVFGLAVLLTVLAFELGQHALRRDPVEIVQPRWAFALMAAVLLVNVSLASWEARWARRLDSDILHADSRHTFADVMTTIAVIGGWQAAANGYPWLDTLAALGVSGAILFLAYGLFRRSIPILVDEVALDSEELISAASTVPGVLGIRAARSRGAGNHAAVDIVAVVAADLDTAASHDIASAIERAIRAALPVESVVVHIEPSPQADPR